MRLPHPYTARYEECGDGVYWHLSCRGERVNGGLSPDMAHAQFAAQGHADAHKHGNSYPYAVTGRWVRS